jgi:hypothetical protein
MTLDRLNPLVESWTDGNLTAQELQELNASIVARGQKSLSRSRLPTWHATCG